MKSIKLLVSFIVLFIVVSTNQAQDIINLIPNKNTFVGVVDMNIINTKAKFEELIKLPLFEKMNEEIGKELFREISGNDATNYLDLQKHGIRKDRKAYFYVNNAKNLMYGAMVFEIEDQAKFAIFAEMLNKKIDENLVATNDNYKTTKKNKIHIVWNSKSAAIFGANISSAYKDSIKNSIMYPPYDYAADTAFVDVVEEIAVEEDVVAEENVIGTPDYNENITNDYAVEDTTSAYNYYNDYTVTDTSAYNYYDNYTDPYNEAYTKSAAICDSIENEWCIANTNLFLQDKGANSLASNTEFTNYIKTGPDAAVMFDYGQFIDMSMNSVMGLGAYGGMGNMPYEFMKGFYKDLGMFAKVELNKDDVKFVVDMKHSEKLNEIYKEVKKTKISKKFLKYMNNDLMGYYAVGIDIEGVSKGFGNTMKQIYPEVPKYGKIASAAMEVIDIMIDEQAIYKVFTGDMVVAVNGVKPVEVVHTTYDYDENYNMTEVMDTTMQMQPEILFMLGIGNVADVNKLLKLLMSFDALKQVGNMYELSYKKADLPVYLKIQDDILFISNNKSYVEQPAVLDKKKQLSKEHTKMFNENTYVAYANTAGITQYFAKQGKSEDDKILTEASALFSSVKMLGKSKNGYSSASCVLELSKTQDNSVVDILKFLNNLYLAKGKKL